MAYGYEGSLVRLVPLEEERHFENCVRWMNDPEVTDTLVVGAFPMTEVVERAWFRSLAERHGKDVLFAIETLEGRHIGNSGVHGIDFQTGTAQTGSFIGDPADRGFGFGTDAAMARNRYVFQVLGLRQVYSSYFAGNEASARMQEKAGYEIWGMKPNAIWKNGEWRDEVCTVLTRERWLALFGGS